MTSLTWGRLIGMPVFWWLCICLSVSGRSVFSISAVDPREQSQLPVQLCPQLRLSQVGRLVPISTFLWRRFCPSSPPVIPPFALKVVPQQRRPGLRASAPGDEDGGPGPGAARDSAHSLHLWALQLCEQQQQKAEEPLMCCSSSLPLFPAADEGEIKCFSARANTYWSAFEPFSLSDRLFILCF